MSNVQSVVTPAQANGAAIPVISTPKVTKTRTTKAKAMASVALPKMTETEKLTAAQAVEIAYEYGSTMAGQDGILTNALQTYKDSEQVQNDMLEALNLGYLTRKLSVSKLEAKRIYELKKYNQDPKLQDDEHRTLEQQRVMDTVRVLWHRAKKMAGLGKSEDQAEAEATRAQKEAEKKEHEQRLIKADALINPKDDVDPFDALSQLVLTMKNLQKKHTAKLVGDRGMAWRDWLAAAPK